MRIGILTGGGDVPGLNACIKAVVERVADKGHKVVGARMGWAPFVYYNPDEPKDRDDWFIDLDSGIVRTIGRTGGTFLHTSRANPAHVSGASLPEFLADRYDGEGPHDVTEHALRVLESQGIETLIAIGGDDTLSFALRLHQEGVPTIAVPKTMDNDVPGTDYCIGFSTAVTRGVEFIHRLRTNAGSHERIAVVEVFGRYSGETSLVTGYLADVDRSIITEIPFHIDKLTALLVEDKAQNPSNYAMVVISEGATLVGGDMMLTGDEDAYGHRKLGGIGALTGELIRERIGEEIIYQQLAYLMRSGVPDSLDLMVATNYAVMAAELAVEGATGRMVALRGGTYGNVPITAIEQGVKRVDVAELYDAEEYRPRVRDVSEKPMFLY